MVLDRILEALPTASVNGLGVTAWSLYVNEARRASLGVKDREAGNTHAPFNLAESCGARYLFVWDDGRISRGYLERRQLEDEPAQTLSYAQAAAYDDPDAAQVLGPAEFPELELHDSAAAAAAGGDTGSLARRLAVVRERLRPPAFNTWSGSFSASEATTRLVTSAGLEISGSGTAIGWHVTVNGEVGDGYSARRNEDDAEFEARLGRLLELARRLQQPADPLPGGILPVILHPNVVQEYVLGTLLHHLEGSTIAHGEGLFRREQFGSDEPVLREDLVLRLDPLQPYKRGSYLFSTEGLPAGRCSYIDRGRLIQPMLDLKYARRLGLEPTPLPYSMDVLHFEGPTPLDLHAALSAAKGGALVLSVLGVHTQDSSSGDFSLSAPQVLRVGDVGLAGRLRATISGNLFEILRSSDLQFVAFEGETTPGLLFPCRLDLK